MLLNQSDTFSNELLSPDGLCVLIQREYHPSINASCRKVEDFLLSSHFGRDLSIPSSELIHLVFMKLADEIRHFFLKESGIIFPAIQKSVKQHKEKDHKEKPHAIHLQNPVLETIHQRQQVIVNLLQKLRHLLGDYNIQPDWHKDWKDCVNEMFLLETKIYQWIHIEGSLLYPKLSTKHHN
jgi:iron-sulfur cluster repair protein YtfE (RIC family)